MQEPSHIPTHENKIKNHNQKHNTTTILNIKQQFKNTTNRINKQCMETMFLKYLASFRNMLKIYICYNNENTMQAWAGAARHSRASPWQIRSGAPLVRLSLKEIVISYITKYLITVVISSKVKHVSCLWASAFVKIQMLVQDSEIFIISCYILCFIVTLSETFLLHYQKRNKQVESYFSFYLLSENIFMKTYLWKHIVEIT